MPLHLRDADAGDAPAFVAIYAPVVRETAISFELHPPDVEEMARRVRTRSKTHPWIVCVEGEAALGYAYASTFRERPAYRFTAETTVYVRDDARRRGVGRLLYEELFARLARQGFRTAVAGVTLPNDPSVALHRAVGFEPAGVLPKVGHKFGRWYDLAFFTRPLASYEAAPAEPTAP